MMKLEVKETGKSWGKAVAETAGAIVLIFSTGVWLGAGMEVGKQAGKALDYKMDRIACKLSKTDVKEFREFRKENDLL